MNLVFKEVVLHNFLSFGDATVTLDNKGYVFVQGVNECPTDNAYSNGSGKSSLFDSIIWCLTGETNRGTKDIVNKHGEDGAYVQLSFDCDGKQFEILRSKNSKEYGTNLKISVYGKDVSGKGIKDSTQVLQ